MRKGRVALCFATLLARSTGERQQHIDYNAPSQAYGIAQGQLAYYRALEQQGFICVITNRAELDHHIAQWETYDAKPSPDDTPPLGFVISMESADPILRPEQLRGWWESGLRIIGPAHYGNGRYVGGTSTESGFNEMGLRLLDGMQSLGFILDMTHLTDKAFWEALDRFSGPLLASHNNCRALVPHQRQFDDAQLKAIIERNGVIGVAFDDWMLYLGWIRGESSPTLVSLSDIANHVDHICQLAGSSHHVGIGSDLDGGFGREQSPHDLDTIADIQRLIPILEARGYSADDIQNIMYRNWLNLLRRVWA
jgi:membrane dipeptidase